ncbi:MAG: SDR family NAD(P)-dependent oxidoreductase [Blastocatellia bacterium]
MKTFIITGATQGLGLATAESLARNSNHRVVLAVRDADRGRKVAAAMGGNVEAHRLDLSSLAEVKQFVSAWQEPLAGLVNNAGVQIINETRRTIDGYEETIAVNHLAALALTVGLMPHLAGGRVLFIGSGTHNPDNRDTAMFGFRGARFTTIDALARGDGDATSTRQLGLDRYATSKFLNMVTASELARRYPAETTAFFTLDPGLMAGTGLARTAPQIFRVVWSSVLRWVAPLLPDTSTPARSGATAAWIMTADDLLSRNGEVFSYDREPSRRVWDRARDPETGRRVLEESLELLKLQAAAFIHRQHKVFAVNGLAFHHSRYMMLVAIVTSKAKGVVHRSL